MLPRGEKGSRDSRRQAEGSESLFPSYGTNYDKTTNRNLNPMCPHSRNSEMPPLLEPSSCLAETEWGFPAWPAEKKHPVYLLAFSIKLSSYAVGLIRTLRVTSMCTFHVWHSATQDSFKYEFADINMCTPSPLIRFRCRLDTWPFRPLSLRCLFGVTIIIINNQACVCAREPVTGRLTVCIHPPHLFSKHFWHIHFGCWLTSQLILNVIISAPKTNDKLRTLFFTFTFSVSLNSKLCGVVSVEHIKPHRIAASPSDGSRHWLCSKHF